MRKFMGIQFFYLKRLLSIKTYLISYLILSVFLLITIVTQDAGLLARGISNMAVPMQVHVFFMTLSGFFIIKNEAKYGVLSFYNNRPKDSLLVISCVLLSHLVISFIAFLVYFLIYFIDFSAMNITGIAFTASFFVYLLIFWFILPALFFLIGVTVALYFPDKKFSFLLILLLWIGLGPFNSFIFSDIELGINQFSNVNNLFYLYPEISTYHYDFFYGFYFDGWITYRILFWLIIFTVLLLCYFIALFKDTVQRSLFLIGGVSLVIVNLFVFNQFIITDNAYSAHGPVETSQADSKQSDYVITGMDITIDHNKSVEITTEVQLKIGKTMKSIAFYLDDDFKIKKISDQKNGPLAFQREGKLISVNLANKNLTAIQIMYKYVGEHSNKTENGFVFYHNQAWVPVKPKNPAVLEPSRLLFTQVENPLYNSNPVAYRIKVNSHMDTYSSLSMDISNRITGVSNHGVFLAIGQLKKVEYNQHTVIKPVVLRKVPAYLETDVKKINSIQNYLKDILDIRIPESSVSRIILTGLSSEQATVVDGLLISSLTPDDYGQMHYPLFKHDGDVESYLLKQLFPEGAKNEFAYNLQQLTVKLLTIHYKNQSDSIPSIGTEAGMGLTSSIGRFIDSLIEINTVIDGKERTLVFIEDKEAQEIVRSIFPTYTKLKDQQKIQFIQDLYRNLSRYAADWKTFDKLFLEKYQGESQ